MKNKNLKGFTLIELLAVVVILAAIASISVPIVQNLIDNSTRSLFIASAKNLASLAETKYLEEKYKGGNSSLDCSSLIDLDTDEYSSCYIEIIDSEAVVTLYGTGKFENMIVCSGTKDEATISQSCQSVIVYDANGGYVVTSSSELEKYEVNKLQNEEYGTLPQAYKNGYTLDGWYTSKTGGSKVSSSTVKTSKYNETVYAHWVSNSYTITLNAGTNSTIPTTSGWTNGSGNTTCTKNANYGDVYGTLPTPTRPGYTFDGWYTTELYQNKVDSTTSIVFSNSHMLYAKWTANTYTVTFDSNGSGDASTAKNVIYGQTYGTLPTLTRNNYRFLGWFTESENGNEVTSSTEVTITAPQTLYAHWEYDTYTVTVSAGLNAVIPATTGWTNSSDNTTSHKDILNNGTYGTLPEPTKTGYTFNGWYTDELYTTKVESTDIFNLQQAQMLYAKWTSNTYTVTFNPEGGTVSPTSKTVIFNATYGDLPTPTRTGYNFNGWYLEDNVTRIYASTNVTNASNHTLYAHWTANTYTVTVNAGSNAVIPTTSGWTNASNNVTSTKDLTYANAYGTLPEPTKTGYTFAGWYLEELYQNKVESTTTLLSATNHMLYAKWTPNTYIVTFNPEGGTVTPTSKTVTYNGTYGDLPSPSRAGYSFNGWFTESTGGTQVYSSSSVTTSSNHTLHAQWTLNSYTVTLSSGTGSTIPTTTGWTNSSDNTSSTKDISYGSVYGTLPTPTKTGYVFKGWYLENTYENEITSSSQFVSTTSHMLYAKWITQFENDSWSTIASNINAGTTSLYNVGDTKTITLSDNNNYKVRIANKSTPSTCTVTGNSQTSCGFIIEFVNVIDTHAMNTTDTNVGGWASSSMRTYLNSTIYNMLPSDLQSVITDTVVVSGYGSSNSANITSLDKLFLPSTVEIFGGTGYQESSPSTTTQLDYYANNNVTTSSYSIANKTDTSSNSYNVWLRGAVSSNATQFMSIFTALNASTSTGGVSPSFRIAPSYTVTLSAGSGAVIPSTTGWTISSDSTSATSNLTLGSYYGTLPTPTKTNYTFDGWYLDEQHTKQVSSMTTMVTNSAHTLYANYVASNYTITLNANGGSVSTSSLTVNPGSAYGSLPTPTYSGKYFAGWYTASSGGTKVESTDVPTGSTTLYAQWVESVSFASDSWATIQAVVKAGAASTAYNVGDTKTINLGTTLGTHTVRIANMSTPSECSTSGFSQTACGFVVEFVDIITTHNINSTYTNVGGWEDSEMRTYVNSDIYNAIVSVTGDIIVDTTVVSGHGSTSGESNYTTTDKVYLLSTHEIWTDGTSNVVSSSDTAYNNTRQLDYYANNSVTTRNYSGAIKQYNGSADYWWLRAANSHSSNYFLLVYSAGDWDYTTASSTFGVSVAFRIA